jgi:hypothetical protein
MSFSSMIVCYALDADLVIRQEDASIVAGLNIILIGGATNNSRYTKSFTQSLCISKTNYSPRTLLPFLEYRIRNMEAPSAGKT